jgi:hypothetical protein
MYTLPLGEAITACAKEGALLFEPVTDIQLDWARTLDVDLVHLNIRNNGLRRSTIFHYASSPYAFVPSSLLGQDVTIPDEVLPSKCYVQNLNTLVIFPKPCTHALTVICQLDGPQRYAIHTRRYELFQAEENLKIKAKWLRNQDLEAILNLDPEDFPLATCSNTASIVPSLPPVPVKPTFMDLVLRTRELIRCWDSIHAALLALTGLKTGQTQFDYMGFEMYQTLEGNLCIDYEPSVWLLLERISLPLQICLSGALSFILGIVHLLSNRRLGDLQDQIKLFTTHFSNQSGLGASNNTPTHRSSFGSQRSVNFADQQNRSRSQSNVGIEMPNLRSALANHNQQLHNPPTVNTVYTDRPTTFVCSRPHYDGQDNSDSEDQSPLYGYGPA